MSIYLLIYCFKLDKTTRTMDDLMYGHYWNLQRKNNSQVSFEAEHLMPQHIGSIAKDPPILSGSVMLSINI
jgi:hypothetical protein